MYILYDKTRVLSRQFGKNILCFYWMQGQDSNLRSPAYETGGDDRTPLPCYIRATQFILLYAVCHGEFLGLQCGIRTHIIPRPKRGAITRLGEPENYSSFFLNFIPT